MDSLLQWHLIAGVLFLLTGFTSALVGPEKVSGFLGNPLSLVCKYEEQFKNNIKCWCKGAQWSSCMNIVKTDGTEQAVRNGRTIIKDNHTNVEFTVTLENLTEKDAGKYWCVIEKIGADIGFPLSIEVLTASAVNASLDDEGDLPTVNIIHQMTSTTRPQDTAHFMRIFNCEFCCFIFVITTGEGVLQRSAKAKEEDLETRINILK
uniref:Ig-like domain-containing protein n=1 Tax=Anolis carolinensis TaxID=28377 RepID=G1KDY8_ANOCA|nr:PREDICTED: CMRF35-like molecule 1 isoform X2 [Anolis carolinensis]|eukprot:XP_008102700.1 PREDICTED: CMRF35-like molecule 1 isoform X2 [Anolis carolinensis]